MFTSRRVRQYVGLGLVVLAYLGGILGWSWAVQTVESDRSPPADTTAVVPPGPAPADSSAGRVPSGTTRQGGGPR